MSRRFESISCEKPLSGCAYQGCFQSLKFMQKWNLPTICDRSYAA